MASACAAAAASRRARRAKAASRGWIRYSTCGACSAACPWHSGESSEIKQLPLLLRQLDLKGCVVSADAAHAQRHTAQVIIEGGGEYVLCMKGNQAATHSAVAVALAAVRATTPHAHFQSVDKGHGRLETRRCWVSGDLDGFAPRGQWKALGSIALIESQREDLATGKVSLEQRCYLSSLPVGGGVEQSAARLAGIARSHWSVEPERRSSIGCNWLLAGSCWHEFGVIDVVQAGLIWSTQEP